MISTRKSSPRRLRSVGVLAATCLVGLGTAAVPADAGTSGRGTLLSATPITALPHEKVVDLLTGSAIDTRVARYGVDAFRLEYRTIGTDGRPTTASGTVALPRNRTTDLRTVSFAHGTIAAKSEAGSVGPDTNRLAPILFASAGFAVAAPDYLGLGTGPGTHPYLDLPSETTASVDMLRAARTHLERTGRTLDRRVFVTGFSQGGASAMALGRALQEGADRRFTLGAVAGISGMYDLFGTQFPEALGEEYTQKKLATISFAYYLVAMNRLYNVYGHPAFAFQKPFYSEVEGLFDGYHSGLEIAQKLPNTPPELLRKWVGTELRNPAGVMRRAAEASDGSCTGWTPRAPIRLFTGTGGDELVPFGNSVHCKETFGSRGVEVPITEVGAVDHNTSAKRAYPLIADFFAQ